VRTYTIDGHEVVIGARSASRCPPGDGASSEELMRTPTWRLYRAKEDGGGGIVFSSARWIASAEARDTWSSDLRRAFANGEFELPLPALGDIAADRISGFESLFAWRHPDKGMISPATSFRSAEDIGLIVALVRMGAARSLQRGGEVAGPRSRSPSTCRGPVPHPQSGSGG